ncbi:DUF596 domain-containing protein [Gilliamella sp. ESL0441]|uniref:DUF596 domain-containing protein n=1 Tax=Gilliamella sp. ESL0441 TaxID=2704654 RepID=UPI001C696D23|nr:DUF596 domain-containing protein [Gilliamella sp. ESL0441]QYN43476.1 DUF596 domain-containing protein [Gilliamella sp. ESL0441]
MIKEAEYNYVVDCAEQQSLNGLWAYIAPNMLPSLKVTGNEIPFQKRKALFFYFVHRLLKEGRLKLAKNGHLLSGSIDDQIKLFYDAFPKTADGMFDKQKLMDDYWFFDDSCPAEAVWVLDDGSLEWT